MNHLRTLGTALVATIVCSTTASAQIVTVGFGAPLAVPLSPWLTALIGVMLTIASVAFLRKRVGSGAAIVMLSVVLGGIGLQAADSVAIPSPPPLNLVTSPASFDYSLYGTSCGGKNIPVASTGPTTIHSISVTPSNAWIVNTTDSTCKVGSSINGTCTIRLELINLDNALQAKC